VARTQRLVALTSRTPAAITVAPQALDPDPLLPPLPRLAWPLVCGPACYLLAIGCAWAWSRRGAFAAQRRSSQARYRAVAALSRNGATSPSEAMRVLRTFLANRLGVPAQALTPDETARLLRERGVPEALAVDGLALLTQLDQAVFQPGASDLPSDCIIRTTDWIEALDTALRRCGGAGKPRAQTRGLLLLVTVLAGVSVGSAADSTQSFLWDRANVRMASAQKPEDFLEAARAYNRLADGPAASGPVFFNLGTALLLAGDGPNAAAALIRAERRMGLTPAIRTNLRQALALRNGQPDADLPWTRTAFFWHFDLPCRTRAQLASAGWMVFWLALCARRLGRRAAREKWRAWTGACRMAGITLIIVFGTSTAISLALDLQDRRLWPERVFSSRVVMEDHP
jgi:hypothetical protein